MRMARQSIFGHGQNTELGWSDPTFGSLRLPKESWGRSSPGNGMRVPFSNVFCPRPGKQITHKEEGYVDHQQTTGTR